MSETAVNVGSGTVVVGVDGSDGSRLALEYALDEGNRRGAPVVIATAWEPPDLWVTHPGSMPSATEMQHAAREATQALVDAVTAERSGRGAPNPATTVEVSSGPAATVLERLSKNAALLVVGHRGRGGVASKLIGSVGLSSVVHAACTVVVVRG